MAFEHRALPLSNTCALCAWQSSLLVFSPVAVRRRRQPSGPARLRDRSHHPARHKQRDENDNQAEDHRLASEVTVTRRNCATSDTTELPISGPCHDAAPPITTISTTLSEVSSVKVLVGSM